MSEDILRFVIDKLLKPIGISLSVPTIIQASLGNNDVLNEMKTALFTFISTQMFSNQNLARKWVQKANINQAIDYLQLIGFDPFLFDLDNSSQHILLTLGWIIWRYDLFGNLYIKLKPVEDLKFLP